MSGMSPWSAFAFSLMTMCIGVPSAIKTFNWLGTLWGARIRLQTPMLYAIGFVSLFVAGGLSGPFLAQPVLDIPLHDTYFVVGHFHLIMGVAAIFGMFAATYYWFPKMFGRMMNEGLGRVHFFLTLIGTYAIFMPMHYLGMAGQTRRYSQFTESVYHTTLTPLQKFMTIAAIITISLQLIFVINFFWSLFKGPKASDNPWEATTLEWSTATPPPHDNFGGVTPVVHNGPYEYGVPGAAKDYVMQTDPVTVSKHGSRHMCMAPYIPSAPVDQIGHGGSPPLPPSGGGGDGHGSSGPNYGARLRRARLGMVCAIATVSMVFISLTTPYIVRKGLPTYDDSSKSYVRDWGEVQLPWLLLAINTALLLVSSVTMEGARRHLARQAALAPVKSIPGVSLGRESRLPWLGITVLL